MAYCKNCGAYIPDGQDKCLACGFSDRPHSESAEAKAGSYHTREEHSYLRREMEEQRRRQQENSRKWAETQYEQRQKAREEEQRYYETKRTDGLKDKKAFSQDSIDKSKVFAAMSYFSALFVVPYFCAPKDRFAMFHAKQGLTLFLAGLAGEALGSLIGLGWLVGIAKFYFIFKGVSNALNNRMEPLPYIGTLLMK